MNTFHPPDRHKPRNEECPHNHDPEQACTCKRQVTRKPFKVCKVHAPGAGHKISPDFVVEIYPSGGTLTIREKRRRKRYHTSIADLYRTPMRQSCLAEIAKKRKEKRERRTLRRSAQRLLKPEVA